MGGFPVFPLPQGTSTSFDNHIDQLIDELLGDPWDKSQENSIEDYSVDRQNCLCSGQSEDSVASEVEDRIEDQQRRYSHDGEEDSFPRYRDLGQQTQRNQRNTQSNCGNSRYSDNGLKNHQHDMRRSAQNGKIRDRDGNMGNYASNQQPMQNRNNIREMNQSNLRRQTGADESNDVYDDFSGHDRHNLYRNAEEPNNGRFGHGSHGTMPNNRDGHTVRNNQNSRVRNPTRLMEVYSLQVPGYKPGELRVKVEGRKVRVIGKQACGCQDSCSVKEFERASTLPEGIDTRNLQATLNKEGTLIVQSKNNHRLSRGHYEDRDVLVEGLDLSPIEDSSKNTENCVKKSSIKLAKIDNRTGKRVPLTKQFEEVPQRTFEHEQQDDGVTIEVVDE